MKKITDNLLLEIVDLLDRSDKALNILERNGKNIITYSDLKKELQEMSRSLKDRYTLEEYSNPNSRNARLEREKNSGREL